MLSSEEITSKILTRCNLTGDCLLWTGPVHKNGKYAMATGRDRKSVALHVAIYEHFVGVIPYNMRVVQSCSNRLCLNHGHMLLVSHGETMKLDPYEVLRKNTREASNGCIEWTRKRKPYGYGSVVLMGEQVAHRLAYRLFKGDIPEGMLVCHHCDNPPCCNPDHLFLGTYLDNAKDRDAKNRLNDRKGENNAHSKLDASTVLEIRELLRYGSSHRGLSKIYGVNRGAIYKIAHRITWGHI